MDRRRALCCLAAGLLLPRVARSATFAYPRLRRGVNLHHLLNWPDVHEVGRAVQYVWPPFQDASYAISDQELARLVARGFDFVRITVDPSIFIVTEAPRRAALMDHAKAIVAQVLKSGLNVVLDLHPVEVNPAYGPTVVVKSISSGPFRAYADMVERVATMLKGFPPDRVVFELMNEPWMTELSEAARWQPMMEELHARARRGAPNLPLILTGVLWSDYRALLRLDTAPFRNSAVLYTFHYYDPHTFTHQGVEGDDAQFIAGLRWPITANQARETAIGLVARIEADTAASRDGTVAAAKMRRSRELLDAVVGGSYDQAHVSRDFDQVVRWADHNRVSHDRIVLGEFGCTVASHGIATGKSRLDWLETVRRAAEQRGFPWAYWLYKGYGGMGLLGNDGSGALDAETMAALGLQSQG